MSTHLRVFNEPQIFSLDAPPANTRVRLGDLLPLLEAAQSSRYLWLRDFLNDEVHITEDLYDVLQEFSGFRPSA